MDDAQLRDLDQFIEQCTRHFDVDSQQLERWNLKYFAGSFYKHLPRQQLPSGYIYVLKDHYTEDYKIGYTSHLVKRIMYLEEKASGDVEYVHILQSERVKETEAFLHKRFQSRRTRPSKDWEWFRLDESHLQEIQNLAERRPRSRQVAANGQSSETAALPPQLSQSAQSAFSEPATEVSPDTRPSKAQIVDSQQSPRARRLLAYFLAAVLILAAAILAYAHFAADAFGLG
ncbi:MAG: GIY-YIG nuclease family protein [Chloroflexota bacterium]|nr:GIY-YIG nuclease family protein [Chloroflexota bacterium]